MQKSRRESGQGDKYRKDQEADAGAEAEYVRLPSLQLSDPPVRQRSLYFDARKRVGDVVPLLIDLSL